MKRTITVRGTGQASARPDSVVITMTLESKDRAYETAMQQAERDIDALGEALVGVGFEKSALKTTNFAVRTNYESVRQPDGGYRQEFAGYVVCHDLKVEFDLTAELLSRTVTALGSCAAHPLLGIAFTVKDPEAIRAELLRSAAENARQKAELLCAASGVKLGELLHISYQWNDAPFRSATNCEVMADSAARPRLAKAIAFEPEDVRVSDTATFLWEIG